MRASALAAAKAPGVEVMNEVLGGGFASRLFSNVRSKKGLAYSVRGGIESNFGRFTGTRPVIQALATLVYSVPASAAAVVVLPDPCRPTIITTVGGIELSLSPSRRSPSMLASSSWTILMSC